MLLMPIFSFERIGLRSFNANVITAFFSNLCPFWRKTKVRFNLTSHARKKIIIIISIPAPNA